MIPYSILGIAATALLSVGSIATEEVAGDGQTGFCKKSADDDCGGKAENKFRRTALITGGSGFVAHHVIEVGWIRSGQCIVFKASFSMFCKYSIH